jgi:hypothetical protein
MSDAIKSLTADEAEELMTTAVGIAAKVKPVIKSKFYGPETEEISISILAAAIFARLNPDTKSK